MYGLIISFLDYNPLKGVMGSKWVGMENFKFLFTQENFFRAIRNTLIISGLKLLFIFPSTIALALLVNEVRHKRYKSVIQSITCFPNFLSWVLIGSVMMALLSPSNGPVNGLIKLLGREPVFFLGHNFWYIVTVVFSDVWQSIGFNSIIYLAAIAGIDPQLYEAAIIDGASRFKQIIYITIPSIMYIAVIMLILWVGKIMDAGFDQIMNTYNMGVLEVADILDTYIYRIGLVKFSYSISTAAGLFKSLIGLLLIVITNKIANMLGENGLW